MKEKYHFIITRYCPKEIIFDGQMTFTEARKAGYYVTYNPIDNRIEFVIY